MSILASFSRSVVEGTTVQAFSFFILTDNCWLQVYKEGPWYIFPLHGGVKESAEGAINVTLAAINRPIGLYVVLKTINFPGCVAHLNASLSNMNADAFSLWCT